MNKNTCSTIDLNTRRSAQMGKKMIKRLDELKGGEILERPVMSWDYQIMLPEGAVLRKEYIEKIEELGIFEVYVKEEKENSNEIVILKSEIESTVKKKVKDILERHTYQNNQELEELCKTADNIILTILEEEQVIEKIYDIKERSTDIYEHSISVCSISTLTALKMGIDKETIHDIGVGCLLHDIGIRYTTIDFSSKDVDSLNKQELAEYVKHPVYGYTSLKDEKWISELSKNIILSHHECIDGSGFPLRKKDLSLVNKIVSVCDTFDEMICGITKKQIKVYEAVEYLKAMKGIKFDSEVVDNFLSFTAVYPAGSHVITNSGELAVVVAQNKDFQDRPIIKIIKDKNGIKVTEERFIDMVKVLNVVIDKVLD